MAIIIFINSDFVIKSQNLRKKTYCLLLNADFQVKLLSNNRYYCTKERKKFLSLERIPEMMYNNVGNFERILSLGRKI